MKFKNVYLSDVAVVAGKEEGKTKYRNFFDKIYDDMYFGEKTYNLAEKKLIEDSVDILLSKTRLSSKDIDYHISGDLLNQLGASSFATLKFGIPFIGVYAACASSTLAMILASNLIAHGEAKKIICSVSSHNKAAERQFRYPNEYGAPKRKTATYTVTGGVSVLLTNKKSKIKLESATIGTPLDMGITDAYHMGACMAASAAEVLVKHLNTMKRKLDYYDLILTGDLGASGLQILKDYLDINYGVKALNIEDGGTILYDKKGYMGGSGCACLPLLFNYIIDKMKHSNLKRVLLIATGALHNSCSCNEKRSIPSVSHAISLEAIK